MPYYIVFTKFDLISSSCSNIVSKFPLATFAGIDIVGSVVALVSKLGSEGLVGLVAVWVLWGIYSKK